MSELIGLKQKLQKAASETEIVDLLNTGKTYEFASDRTKRSWKNSSKRRINFLSGKKPEVVEVVEDDTENVVVKKKRGNKKKLN